ncbi:hypothetical protein [Saccharothrix luteola]|uniref:hypothetical protein n=1 Tax=Saccharothrix luteola TaxID=2893018 RepID=UPI001E378CFA|nr:hypothetical protein [Saccharothrix luteola]MCC8247912.1 hypothetical protein [Saccharothrix luteola]
MGKKWVLAAVAGLVGAAGVVVLSRRGAGSDEPVRTVAVRRREAPRRADARRVVVPRVVVPRQVGAGKGGVKVGAGKGGVRKGAARR